MMQRALRPSALVPRGLDVEWSLAVALENLRTDG